jgi:GxxExxY protein
MISDTNSNKKYEKIPKHIEDAASAAVDSAFHVHKKLGGGMLERIYERFMEVGLKRRGCTVKRQVRFPIVYDGEEYDEYYIVDMLVNDCLILELKVVEMVLPVHKYQLLSYLKLSGMRLGLLINFNQANIGEGITRMIN